MHSRQRVKGRRGGDRERFARIPLSVLESDAVTALGHAAFRVLVILAGQYWGGNNGALALTERYARRYGFRGRDTIYRALRQLEAHGLIVCTRRGMKMKKVFTQYALGWEDINNREGQPLDVPELRDNSRWLNWHGPPRTGRRKTKIHTNGRESSIPTAGTDAPNSVPTSASSSAVSIPTKGNTLRISAHSASERASDAGVSAVCDLASNVGKLLEELPDLSDSDLARLLAVDVTAITLVRRTRSLPANGQDHFSTEIDK